MSLLVLFSTVSFTVEKHFCGDVLIDVSVFTEAEKCAMEETEKELEAITKKSCCKDTIDVFQGQDELIVKSFDNSDFEHQLFIASYIYSYVNLFEGLPQHIIPHKNYYPPNLVEDLNLMDRVFLI
ncbi:MAG: hypothetical protein HKO81_10525 [Flavobacteriaceae bacterium]|nr:hypothetical protein [Flavobacteriaceae bacterium]